MRYITVFILSLIFWLLLTFKITVPNLIVGSVASADLLNYFCQVFLSIMFISSFSLIVISGFLFTLLVFIWECIKANLDVAYRVLHPAMPIRPGIVKVKTTLKSELAKTLLANSITMTPGYNIR